MVTEIGLCAFDVMGDSPVGEKALFLLYLFFLHFYHGIVREYQDSLPNFSIFKQYLDILSFSGIKYI